MATSGILKSLRLRLSAQHFSFLASMDLSKAVKSRNEESPAHAPVYKASAGQLRLRNTILKYPFCGGGGGTGTSRAGLSCRREYFYPQSWQSASYTQLRSFLKIHRRLPLTNFCFNFATCRAVDPHSFFAEPDPDPAVLLSADRIRIQPNKICNKIIYEVLKQTKKISPQL